MLNLVAMTERESIISNIMKIVAISKSSKSYLKLIILSVVKAILVNVFKGEVKDIKGTEFLLSNSDEVTNQQLNKALDIIKLSYSYLTEKGKDFINKCDLAKMYDDIPNEIYRYIEMQCVTHMNELLNNKEYSKELINLCNG